jgi:hypothetical protein
MLLALATLRAGTESSTDYESADAAVLLQS